MSRRIHRACVIALVLAATALGACRTPAIHGKVVLCPTPALIGPAAVVVSDSDRDKVGVQTVDRDTPAIGICNAVQAAASSAGFKTELDSGQTAVKIFATDSDRVKVEAKNVRVLVQDF